MKDSCYCLHHSAHASLSLPTRGSCQGKVQFVAHYCLCSPSSGLGSLNMMDVVPDWVSRYTDKTALSKHIHYQCKHIKIAADN